MIQIDTALVVGGGIAGCAAAIALAEKGAQVTMLEKQPEWRFQSSGIFIYSNGLESLKRLGVLEEIVDSGYVVRDGRNIYLDHRGEPIVDTLYPRGLTPDIPAIVGIKRAELHRVLAERLADLDVEVRLATGVESVDNSSEKATVTLTDGTRCSYGLVVGADGIRSQIRGLVSGDITPRYTGLGVWRSVHSRPEEIDAKIMMLGEGKRLGIMPISDDKLYLFGTMKEAQDTWYEPEMWPHLMQSRFAEFAGPARTFLDELDEHAEVLFTRVEEIIAPLPWARGRVVMIGDAAHASTPFMGQGGAMAVGDAIVLADMLSEGGSVTSTLEAFGHRRYPVCRYVQDASRAVGERGATENPDTVIRRNATMEQAAQSEVDEFFRELDASEDQARWAGI